MSIEQRRTSRLRPLLLFLVGVAIVQSMWIAVVPPFRGSDEFDHAYRASGVAHGQWRATQVPEDGRGLLVVADDSLVRAARAQCDALPYPGPDNCVAPERLADGKVLVASGAANYHPMFYWVIGKVADPFGGATALYAMRVAGALLCLAFFGLAAWAVTGGRSPTWAGAGLVVALSPVMLYSSVVAAPNGLEMASALALWSSLLALGQDVGERPVRGLLVVAFVAATVLATLRMLGPLFVALIVLTVIALRFGSLARVAVRHPRLVGLGSVAVVGAVATSAFWILSTGSLEPAPVRQGGGWQLSTLLLWPLQAIAAFPLRDQAGAMIAYPIYGLAFLGFVVGAIRVGTSRERWSLVGVTAAAFLLPVGLTALTFAGRGAMWQGRYGLALSAGVVVVAAVVVARRRVPARLSRPLLVSGAVALGVASTACQLKVLRDELGRAPSVNDPGWLSPPTWLVVVAACVGWALLLKFCLGTADAER